MENVRSKPLNLTCKLIDQYDSEAAKKYITESNKAKVFVKNATSAIELVKEFKKERHPLYLGFSDMSTLRLHEIEIRESLKDSALEGLLDEQFGNSKTRCLPEEYRVFQPSANSYLLRFMYHRLAIPQHFVHFLSTRLAPRLSISKIISLRVAIFELDLGLQMYSIQMHDNHEVNRLASTQQQFELIEEYPEQVVLNMCQTFGSHGIYGRHMASLLVKHSISYLRSDNLSALNNNYYTVEGYNESRGSLSSERYFECKLLEMLASLEHADNKRQASRNNVRAIVEACSNYVALQSGTPYSEETQCILSMVTVSINYFNKFI